MATYSVIVVPNAVSVENESKNGVVQWYNGTFAFSKMYHNPTQLTVERAKRRLIILLILYLYIIIYYNI